MTKRDYQAIARAMHKYSPTADERHDMELRSAAGRWDSIVAELSDVCASDNPRFNRALFIEACETGRCKGMKA